MNDLRRTALPELPPLPAGTLHEPEEEVLDDALALVSRINERMRKSAETLTPTGVQRVA
jgi:hypothetical protein